MINLGKSRNGALAAAAAGSLFDGDRRRYAEYGVDVRPRRRLHELPRVSVQRLKVAPLAFGKQNIESQSALAAARYTGDHREFVDPQADVDIFEIVLASAVNLDHRGCRRVSWSCGRIANAAVPCIHLGEGAPGVRHGGVHDLCGRAGAEDAAAGVAALRTQIDDPVG